ncbi:uncharacterized protein METZ01_LOCUS507119, partial [marine metagenome]
PNRAGWMYSCDDAVKDMPNTVSQQGDE